MADNIQNALNGFAQKIENKEVAPVDSTVNGPNTSEDEDLFGGAIIAGFDAKDVSSSEDLEEADPELSIQERWQRKIREKMADMASKDPNQFTSESDKLVRELLQYRKDMMIKYGMTAEEADQAAENRLNKKATETNTEFIKNNPNLAIIKIDKSNSDDLAFTEEEKAKIVKTKAIRLIEVEDKELATINVKTEDAGNALYRAIHRVSCNISKYSMPALNTFDVCEFSGATTTQLVQAVYNENDSLYRKYQEQLELIYAKFNGSTTMDKYDVNGEILMDKDAFAQWYRFHDIPAAMYAIYVASSTEEIRSTFDCPRSDGGCDKSFENTYNCKSLIKYDDIPARYQEDLDLILANENNRTDMIKLKDERRLAKRFKSPYTNNIYEINAPSIARALGILRFTRPRDSYSQYIALYAMMFNAIYIYDSKDGQHFKISADDPRSIIEFMYGITDIEIKLITKVITDFNYVPTFKLTTKCTHCGKERESEFSIDQLVFLKAQNIGEEIEL